jgi:hypothetical protein
MAYIGMPESIAFVIDADLNSVILNFLFSPAAAIIYFAYLEQ